MTRQFDRNELEREKYNQDHGSTRHLKEEIQELKKVIVKLEKKIEKLENK
jgi:hypothetical protein